MSAETIDCRSEIGVTVGLVDAIIAICRVLAPRVRLEENKNSNVGALWFTPLRPALEDLTSDEDLAYILDVVNRIALDIKKVYPDWPGRCRQCGGNHSPWDTCPAVAAFEEGK